MEAVALEEWTEAEEVEELAVEVFEAATVVEVVFVVALGVLVAMVAGCRPSALRNALHDQGEALRPYLATRFLRCTNSQLPAYP